MTVMVALLRGVNVGGKTSLPMAELRAAAEGLGYEDVSTYIQSGNLLLRSSDGAATVAEDLSVAIASLGGVQPAVMVRTRSQLAEVVDGNPFIRRGEDVGACHVVFGERAARSGLAGLDLAACAPEEAVAVGKELYLLLPGGVGRSKLASELTRASKGAVGTMRSWKTVTKLLELASAMG